MIYIFGITLIYTFIRQRDELMRSKKTLAIYLLLSILGLSMGVVYMINPYLHSVTSLIEKYMK